MFIVHFLKNGYGEEEEMNLEKERELFEPGQKKRF